jgi:hypothetical protein
VTRRLEFASARKAAAEPAPAPTSPAARNASESPSIADFDRDQMKEALLAVVGTNWMERDAAIRAAAKRLGFGRLSNRIRAAFASAVNGLIRQKELQYEGTQVRRKG